jgi:predicted secreted Zn-dependent protease
MYFVANLMLFTVVKGITKNWLAIGEIMSELGHSTMENQTLCGDRLVTEGLKCRTIRREIESVLREVFSDRRKSFSSFV